MAHNLTTALVLEQIVDTSVSIRGYDPIATLRRAQLGQINDLTSMLRQFNT